LRFSVVPTAQELARVGLFALPLVPLGETSATESQALARALIAYEAAVAESGARDAVGPLVGFLDTHPSSVWQPALLVNLGTIYRQTGHFSEAYDSWQHAWQLTEHLTDEHGRALGDAAVGHLTQLQAYLGRKEELEPLLAQLQTRPLRGTAAELVSESARGLADMLSAPELSFKCGPFALSRILQYQQRAASQSSLDRLHAAHSTSKGLSLTAVRALSQQAGMNYQMVFRTPGAVVVLPAVAHWKVGHYAAIVDRERGRYRVQDSTFGEDIRMSPQTLDEQASGYFLIPSGSLPDGYRAVSAAEGGGIWGRGDTGNNKDNGATGASEGAGLSPQGSSCPAGCTAWNVEPMVVSLALHDVPVGHSTAVGPAVRFDLHYSQRDVQQPQLFNYANLGRKWTTSWLSYVTDNDNVNGTVELYRRGGGNETFAFDPSTDVSKPGPFSQTVITRSRDASGHATKFSRQFSDGSREEFEQAFGTKYFMTAVVDPYGNAARIQYDATMRMTTLTDALGQITTLSYELDSDPLKITKVTDPFGRSATFAYTTDGNLASITDTLGITSKYSYGPGDFISSLETPYGTTRFEYGDSLTDKSLGNTRFLIITDALGRKSRVEFRQAAPGIAASASAATTPAGMRTKNDLLQWRNTFIWNAEQYAQAQNNGALDYTKARIIHWLHTLDNSTARVVESVKDPLEYRVWFDYPGQTQAIYVGTSSQPLHVGRVLAGGATQLASFEYNAFGKVTLTTDPNGRKFGYEYASNGIDLLAVGALSAGAAERLISVRYDDRHRPVSITSAAGGSSSYEYNARGQVTKATDALGRATAYSYDALGSLVNVEMPGGARYAFTYDALGRLASATDPLGDTLGYEYDAADRRTRVLYSDGTTDEYAYHLLDLTQVKDREGHTTQLTFDAERQVTQLIDALGQTAKLERGLDGTLASITDASGQMTQWIRDLQGRAVSKLFADGSSLRLEYEANGDRLHSVTDARGQVTVYEYNPDDTLSKIAHNKSLTPTAAVSFKYDAAYQRVVSMTDGTGETSYTYHPLSDAKPGAGALASVTSPVAGAQGMTDTVSYDYDVLGRGVRQSVNGEEQTASYDAADRVTTVSNALDAFTASYADTTARPHEIASNHGPRALLAYYEAKAHGRLRQIDVTKPSGQPLAHFGYQYDRRGQIAAFAESYLDKELPAFQSSATSGLALPSSRSKGERPPPSDGSDGMGLRTSLNPALWLMLGALLLLACLCARRRLSAALVPLLVPVVMVSSCSEPLRRVANGNAQLNVYHYDEIARLTSVTIQESTATGAAGSGKVASVGYGLSGPSYQYGYDARSNLTSITAQGKTQSLKYTATNALEAAAYDANGNPEQLDDTKYDWDAQDRLVKIIAGDRQSDFSYDGLDRIVRIVERRAGKVEKDHAYGWCGAVRCLERDNLQSGSPVSKQYFGQGFIAGGKRYYYVTDHLGSVRQLVDDTGRVRAQYDYDPYGRATKLRGDLDSDVQYAGYFQHAPSGLALALYRAYDPTHGRWLNRDPIQEAGDLNMYAYTAGDPVNRTDPLGLWAGIDDAIASGVGALVGVAIQGGIDAVHGELSSWQDYTAAAVGGAAGGEAMLYTGPVGAGAAAGAASNVTRQGLNWATGKQCGFSVTSLALETGAGALGGAIAKGAGKLVSGAAARGATGVGTAIVRYFPPNNGFLGSAAKSVLQVGQRIDRYGGSAVSRFFSPAGTPLAARSLPPETAAQALRSFEVLKPLEVEAGTVAPWFGQMGMGTQYRAGMTLSELLEQGFIKEVF
jgi:RHS repeat-associated protein